MTSLEAYEAKERERAEKIGKLFQFADDVGSTLDLRNPNTGEIQFKTWQEALDFQTLCEENNIEVYLVEADARPTSMDSGYYKIRPRL